MNDVEYDFKPSEIFAPDPNYKFDEKELEKSIEKNKAIIARARENRKIDMLNEIIEESKHIVFLGGAGVSTESGIPSFRSKDGLYNKQDRKFRKYKPEYLLGYDCLNKKPEIFFCYF